MTTIGQIKLKNVLLCDDVRREQDTNKHILIGVYSGGIRTAGELPAFMGMGFYIELSVPPGAHELEVRISGPGKGSAIMKGRIDQPPGEEVSTMVLPRMELLLEKEGILRVDMRSGGSRWVNLLKKEVSSTASRPLSEQSAPDAQESSSPPEPSRPSSRGRRRRS